MKKLLLILTMILLTIGPVSAEYVSDLIVTNKPWIDSRTYSSLSSVILIIGSTEKTILIQQNETVTDLDIPSNISLQFAPGGMITYSGHLNIHGTSISAPSGQQIFDATGAGEADFSQGTNLRSTWFEDLHEMFDQTLDNYVTLIIDSGWGAAVDADCQVGDNVTLRWEGSGNRIVINSGFELSNIKNIEAGGYQIFSGSGDLDFLDGTHLRLSWFNRLRTIVNWIESEDIVLSIDGDNTIDYSTTVPSNITLEFDLYDGLLSPLAGITVTLNCPIISGNRKIFDASSGSFSGDPIVDYLNVRWFADGDTTNELAGIQDCLDMSTGKTVKFPQPSSTYYGISGILNPAEDSRIIGIGWPIIHQLESNQIIFNILNGYDNIEIDHLQLTVAGTYSGTYAGRSAIDVNQEGGSTGNRNIRIHDIRVSSCSITGIGGGGVTDLWVYNNDIDVSSGEHGIYFDCQLASASEDINISGNNIIGNNSQGAGIKISGNATRVNITGGNTVDSSYSYALTVTIQSGKSPSYVTVSDFIANESGVGFNSGAYFDTVDHLTVNNFTAHNLATDGIALVSCTNFTIDKFIIDTTNSTSYYGIKFQGCSHGRASNGILIDCLRAILIDSTSSYIDIYNNYSNHTGNGGSRGINYSGASVAEIWIHDNIFIGTAAAVDYVLPYTKCWNNKYSSTQTIGTDNRAAHAFTSGSIADGTSAGYAKSTAAIDYTVIGYVRRKNATDNLWNLTGVSTTAAQYKKVALCLDSGGNGRIVEGTAASSQISAQVPYIRPDYCCVGIVEIPNNYAGGALAGFTMYNVVGPFQVY